jgi:hypothetical protein
LGGGYLTELEGKRAAIIIGINEYEDEHLPPLGGAENDALEIAEILRQNGNFNIETRQTLLGREATFRKIGRAIRDIFEKDGNPYDLVVLYISGYFVYDKYRNGFIAPYDFSIEEPFVTGMSIKTLVEMMSQYPAATDAQVILIVDSCIKSIAEPESSKTQARFQDQLFRYGVKDLGDQINVILLSQSNDRELKENIRCIHQNKDVEHTHGNFTFYLIKGLEGDASDENGIVTINRLYEYIHREMVTDRKPRPTMTMQNTRLGNVKLAIAQSRYKQYLEELVDDARQYLERYKNVYGLKKSAEIINQINWLQPDSSLAKDLKSLLVERLDKYRENVSQWLDANKEQLQAESKKSPSWRWLYDNRIKEIAEKVNFGEILKADPVTLCLLNKIDTVRVDMRRRDSFTMDCISCLDSPHMLEVSRENLQSQPEVSQSSLKNQLDEI